MQVKLPDLHKFWPFPRTMSPWHDEVTPGSSDWTESFQIFSPAQQKKFRLYDVGLLGSLCYPHQKREHLRIACDLLNILFVFDDVTDVQTPDEVREIARISMDALRSPEKKRPEGEHKVGLIHQSYMQNMLRTCSATSHRRFIATYKEYVESVIEEAADRQNDSVRKSLDDYLLLRRFTGAVGPAFACLLLPLEIPDSVLLDERITALEYMAMDMIGVANDVVSFNYEYARGDIHNAVVVVMHQHNLSVQDALDHVNEWYHKQAMIFLEKMIDLPECPDQKTRDQLKTYIWSVANWVTANYEWSFSGTRRFFGSDSEVESVKESMIVQLLPTSRQVAVSA